MFKTLVLTAGLSLISMTAHAANFSLSGKTLTYSGDVETGDGERLGKYLENYDIDRIVLDSNGGAAMEGYALGYALWGFEGVVAVETKCLSACGTAFLAATNKEITGVVGYHVAWSQSEQPTNDAMKSGQILGLINTNYILDMGYTVQFGWLSTVYTSMDTFFVFTSVADLEAFKGNYDDFLELPERWVADHVAGPQRLQMLIGGF